MTVRVKICGITRLEDALLAAKLGADALGFNLWPGSKRHLHAMDASAIVERLPPFVAAVGVFVNQPPREVRHLSAIASLHAIQLHGDEPPEDLREHVLPVIKAFRVGSAADLAGLARYRAARAFLLDAPSEGFGGSGRNFDWSLAREAAGDRPLVLAGGLTPDNVAEAVRAVRPWAVDVASGVETSPGVKDPGRMERFIRAAKEAGA